LPDCRFARPLLAICYASVRKRIPFPQVQAGFKRPNGNVGWGYEMGVCLSVYMDLNAPSGTYAAVLDLPDGRRLEGTFDHHT
jgi:hypothetical protein